MSTTTSWRQLITQKISVSPDRCNACGNCVGVCPFMVFEIKRTGRNRKSAVPVHQEDCFLCQSCQAQCPEDAITIEW